MAMANVIVIFISFICVVKTSVVVNIYDDGAKDVQQAVHQLKDCNVGACNDLCRRLGFAGGVCIGSSCSCDNSHKTKELEAPKASNGICNPVACRMWCESMGIEGGKCVNGICDCVAHSEKSKETQSMKDCSPRACDQLCRRLGFTGGACVGDKCDCDNFRNPEIFQAVDTCNMNACDQLCRRLGFPGGACVGDKCDCDSREHKDDDLIDEQCNVLFCSERCLMQGYEISRCSDTKCICNNDITLSKTDKSSAVAKKLNRQIKHIPKFTGISRHLVQLEQCDENQCNNSCQSQNYPGGVCILGTCFCYY